MKRLLGRLTYSNVVSSICLVLVLGGGTAFAAAKLGKGSVGTSQLKNGAVTAGKIKAGAVTGEKVAAESLTGADIKASTLGTVPTADTARTATTAQSAQNAATAKTADSATTAKSAESAKTAQSADTAQTANVASTASSAVTAGSAISAQTAKSADTAASAKVAETLAGHTAFSIFLPEGGREIATIAGLAIRVDCKTDEAGEEIGRMIVVGSAEGESTLVVAGEGSSSVAASEEATFFELKNTTGTKTAGVGGDVTAIAPGGSSFTLAGPTIGFNLTNHEEQCFFSGVVDQPTQIPVQ